MSANCNVLATVDTPVNSELDTRVSSVKAHVNIFDYESVKDAHL